MMLQIWTWDMIFRGLFIASFMIAPCMLINWFLTNWVCSKHEHAQREIIKQLEEVLSKCIRGDDNG